MRVSFLVDGFNLYHSVKSAEKQIGKRLLWLDIHSLCQTLVSSSLGPKAKLQSVHYFSALAKHLVHHKPDVVRRHEVFIKAIQDAGVQVTLANFKKKDKTYRLSEFKVRFPPFRRWRRIPLDSVRLSHRSHEEKETDVAIACKLLELLCRGECDAVVLMSGDTDLAPAIRTAKVLYSSATVMMAFPFDRHNNDLARIADRSFKLSAALYERHQFPDVITTKKNKTLIKPPTW